MTDASCCGFDFESLSKPLEGVAKPCNSWRRKFFLVEG